MSVPFEYVHHLVTVPVRVGDVDTRFVLDTGIGPTVVSERIACERTGATFSGRRMSGQEVTLELARLPTLAFGPLVREDVEVGVLDLSGFPPELAERGGFLSLACFEDAAVTFDYARGRIAVGGPAEGVPVAVRVERDGPSLTMFMPLELPQGQTIEVEVDTGSDVLILDERFLSLAAGDVRRVDGVDETGNRYTRAFAELDGAVRPLGAPALAQERPRAMFQSIIHDGLVGDDFLRRFRVTYDVPGARMLFA